MTPDPSPPTITVRCGRCRARETWILPRPHMIPLIADLAHRKGWRLTTDQDLCPTHNPDWAPLAPRHVPRPQMHHRLQWTRDLIGRVAELTNQRRSWDEIARIVGDETGAIYSADAPAIWLRVRRAPLTMPWEQQ